MFGMLTIGIVGGIGPESTIDYYRRLITSYRRLRTDGSHPQIVINSIDMKKMLGFVEQNQLADLTEYLVNEVRKLVSAGAQVALIAANTPHIVFDDLQRYSPIPLVSIVEATCAEAKALGLEKLGLFGTRFTMQAGFYADVFKREGISLVIPNASEQDYIHDKYFIELVPGILLPETRAGLLQIVYRMIERANIDGLILGGTELPLIFEHVTEPPVPFLDTTGIHVKQVLVRAQINAG
jgi:aspartate racemase